MTAANMKIVYSGGNEPLMGKESTDGVFFLVGGYSIQISAIKLSAI